MLEKKIRFYTCIIIFATALTISLPAASALAQMAPQNPLHKLPSDLRAKISPDLNESLSNVNYTEPIRVLIRLKKKKLQELDPPSFTHRRKQILRKLKKQAQRNQTDIIQLLKRKRSARIKRLLPRRLRKYNVVPKVLNHIRNYWVSNTVAATVSPEELEEIAAHPDVMEISENTVVSIPPVEAMGEDDGPFLDLWNFAAIGLDQISGLGLDGEGVRIGFIDTGIY
ncbi:MAG: protease inhibitor I9 family protein, partial [Deltaproteobacteria bacterium]|nr:protease inhibitor I9 family protein [Deltaproteobacteria bacterium]